MISIGNTVRIKDKPRWQEITRYKSALANKTGKVIRTFTGMGGDQYCEVQLEYYSQVVRSEDLELCSTEEA